MTKQNNSNIKLGLLVLAGLFLFIATLYVVGKNQNIFGSSYEIKARFSNINGLMKGNNIRFSGIQAGTVKRITIIDDSTIEVSMLIDKSLQPFIKKNALASIGTEGLIGNKIINILPSKENAAVALEGDLLTVHKTIDTDEMLETLSGTNKNIALISEDLRITVHRINNSTALWGLLKDSGMAANIRTTMTNIRVASSNARNMTDQLNALVDDVRHGKGSVGALLADSSFARDLNRALVNIGSAGERASEAAGQLNTTIKDIQADLTNGKGTANALLRDTGLVVKLNASLDNIQKGTDAFSQNMEALKHNFLFRGYFRRLEKQQKKESRKLTSN